MAKKKKTPSSTPQAQNTNETPAEPIAPPSTATKQPSIPWEKDGVDGGKSSMSILLNWLTTSNNYQRWRGDKAHGTTKKSICSEIIQLMVAQGINHRDVKGQLFILV